MRNIFFGDYVFRKSKTEYFDFVEIDRNALLFLFNNKYISQCTRGVGSNYFLILTGNDINVKYT